MSKDSAEFPGCEFFAEKAGSHLVMQFALDTLCLLAIGNTHSRPDLVELGRRMYPKTLQRFRGELDITPVRDPFVLLQTVHVIQLCEMFECISFDGWGWQTHMNGLAAIIKGASPEGKQDCGNQGRWLIEKDNRISFSLWDGLMSRKHLETAEELFAVPGHSPDAEMASRLVIDRQVPGVLRYASHVAKFGKRASAIAVSDAVGAILGMEGRLHIAITAAYTGQTEMPYRVVKTDRLDGCFKGDPEIFPTALVFTNMANALKSVHYLMCLLALRQVHLEIRTAVKTTAYSLSLYEDAGSLNQGAEECAEKLCKSVIYMTQSKNGLFGLITAIPPLQMAARWYRNTGNCRKMKWCQQIARLLQQRGLAVPSELLPA